MTSIMNTESNRTPFIATLVGSQLITDQDHDEVRHITMQIDDPDFDYVEGQSIAINVPGPHDFGNNNHIRQYSIANAHKIEDGDLRKISILVRRCFYIDEFSGERYPGVASNYLCDAKVGDKINFTGPYRSPFNIPEDRSANLVMIGTGTGIAPFRGILQRIYDKHQGWDGEVSLYYGAKSGMELYYMNDENSDVSNYFTEESFNAIRSVTKKSFSDGADALSEDMDNHLDRVISQLKGANTYLFIAGQKKVSKIMDAKLAEAMGPNREWESLRDRMITEGRLSELLYE